MPLPQRKGLRRLDEAARPFGVFFHIHSQTPFRLTTRSMAGVLDCGPHSQAAPALRPQAAPAGTRAITRMAWFI
jgi:hypothetical protein